MTDSKQKSLVERFLGLFSEVDAGEGKTVLLLTLISFLILASYYLLKPVREALVLSLKGGAEIKTYASVAQGILLIGTVQIYSWLGSRMGRRALINSVTLFFAVCLLLFYALGKAHVNLGLTFFLWVGIFNLIIVSQFWSFANDIYTVGEGQRLFPIIAFGSSFGAVVGSYVADRLLGPVGIFELLLIGDAILIFSLLITNYVDHREKERMKTVAASKEKEVEKPLGKEGGFKLVFRNKYLFLIALMILFLNLVKTTGEYLLGRTLTENASQLIAEHAAGMSSKEEYIGKFYSSFFGAVNLLGLLAQLFLVSRMIKYLKIKGSLLVYPIVAFFSYGLMAFYPILSMIRKAKVAENATDYSLGNTVKNALFLPVSREDKYKAKQAIDTFFVRLGDMFSAAIVFIGTNWLIMNTQHFALTNIFFAAICFVLAIWVGLEYQKRTSQKN
jgi:AAA family ATP:ADP antiporter